MDDVGSRPRRVAAGLACAVGLVICLAAGVASAGGTFVQATAVELLPAVPVEGPPFDAALTAADAQWQLAFESGFSQRTLAAADLVRWGTFAEPVAGPIVLLSDGGLLVADVLGTDRERLRVDSPVLGPLELPLDRLAAVVFDLPGARRQRDLLLDRLARSGGGVDRLLLGNGDEVDGMIESIGNGTLRLAAGDGPIEIETRTIAAIVFNPLLRRQAMPRGQWAWVGLADGSRLAATQIVREAASLRLTTAAAATWKTSAAELVALQPIGGRATYLSDLKPADYRHVPFLSLRWPYETDRNVEGGWLRCGGRLYLKGLGMHSASRLSYELDGSYRRFEAEVGIDDATSGGGSVRFRVFVDGRQQYASETLRGGMPPVPVAVDLEGGKRLDLVVDYADHADQLDHADWLDPRLVR